MKKAGVVLGLGNPLMADEGIGPYLIQRLSQMGGQYPSVDFIDAGTGGLSVLHCIEGRRKAVIIDCAFMDEAPGTIRRFMPEDVRSTKVLAHQSLHEADLMHLITLGRQLAQLPQEIVIFGIQPAVVALGQGLSRTIADKADEYVSLILRELEA
jgi:hydrogenase maturation protease